MAAFNHLLQFFCVPPCQSAMNFNTSSLVITITQSLSDYHRHHHNQIWSKSSHLVEKHPYQPTCRWLLLKVPPLYLLLLLLVLATSTVQCQSHRVSFDLQELSHDSPIIDPEKVIKLELKRGESLEYVLETHLLSNQSLRLYLTKPYKVRIVEALKKMEPLVVVNNDQVHNPRIRFSKGNANHRGYYHLYSFVYDLEGRLVNYDRIDFHLSVVGKYRI